jgi:hypothetical protein
MAEGVRGDAEADLLRQGRENGPRSLDELTRTRVGTQWDAAQVLFAYAPERAVQLADELTRETLEAAGYAVEAAAPPSDDVVGAYLTAHGTARAIAYGSVTRAELRRAMRCYRGLFAELLAEPAADAPMTRDRDDDAVQKPRPSARGGGLRRRH